MTSFLLKRQKITIMIVCEGWTGCTCRKSSWQKTIAQTLSTLVFIAFFSGFLDYKKEHVSFLSSTMSNICNCRPWWRSQALCYGVGQGDRWDDHDCWAEVGIYIILSILKNLQNQSWRKESCIIQKEGEIKDLMKTNWIRMDNRADIGASEPRNLGQEAVANQAATRFPLDFWDEIKT